MRVLLLILLSIQLQAQNVFVKTKAYEALYSHEYGQPLYVKYLLYKGGGNCSRKDMRFHQDSIQLKVSHKDYSKSGFDQGHLANAEDFAYDCKLEELTFRYYNCIPQTLQLNRGVWRTFEDLIREESQVDSLIIICGPLLEKEKIPIKKGSDVIHTTENFKVVYSYKQKQIIYCRLFLNTDKPKMIDVDPSILEKRISFNIYRLLPKD